MGIGLNVVNGERKVFWTLCLMGAFAILSSTMAKNPVLWPFASSLGTTTEWKGVIQAASTIPGILVSLPAASLSDVVGRKRFLILAGIVFASAPFLYMIITVWWQLILVRFYHGFATAIFVPVAEASVAELFPTKRGERISLFSSATYVGRVAAPLLGGYILFVTDWSFRLVYLAVGVSGVIALVTGLAFLAERKEQPSGVEERTKRQTVRSMFRGWVTVAGNHGVLVTSFVQACQYYAYGAVEIFLAGYLLDVVGLDAFSTGIVMASLIAVPIVVRPYMGRVSDKVGRRIVIAAGCVVGGLPLAAIPFVNAFPLLLLLAAAYGVGYAMVVASTSALVSELVPQYVGTSMGFLDMLMDVGQTIGPVVTGLISATVLSYQGSFPALTAVLLFSCLVFGLSGAGKMRRRPEE